MKWSRQNKHNPETQSGYQVFMATVLANNFLLHTQHTQSNTSIPPDFVGGESCIHSFIFVDELLLTRTGSFEVSLEKKNWKKRPREKNH